MHFNFNLQFKITFNIYRKKKSYLNQYLYITSIILCYVFRRSRCQGTLNPLVHRRIYEGFFFGMARKTHFQGFLERPL